MNHLQGTVLIVIVIVGLIAMIGQLLNIIGRFRQNPAIAHFWRRPAAQRISRKAVFTAHLIRQELLTITGIGVLMNYAGVLLASNMASTLFLDMCGTALVACLLGPWWGAITGLISNGLVNYVAFPGDADRAIFPWVLVNMAGGFFWGYCSRHEKFKLYMREQKPSAQSHIMFLLVFGMLGSLVMSIPGAFVQAAAKADQSVMLNSTVAAGIAKLISKFIGFNTTAGKLLYFWSSQTVYSIPDKAISAAIALAIIRVAFPVYERELIHGGPSRPFPHDDWSGPIVLGLLYSPIYITFIFRHNLYDYTRYWLLWSLPWFLISAQIIYLAFFIRIPRDIVSARLKRGQLYQYVTEIGRRSAVHSFFERLVLITVISSFIFLGAIPLLITQVGQFYSVALNFCFVVYGFLFTIYILELAVGQNTLITGTIAAVQAIFRTIEAKLVSKIDSEDIRPNTRGVFRQLRRFKDMDPISEIVLPRAQMLKRGKVRHLYDLGSQVAIIASDRVVAFDRTLPTAIPGKGAALTKLSAFWFKHLAAASPHHFLSSSISEFPPSIGDLTQYADRSMLVRRLQMLPIECIVRGYLAGSAWEEYNRTGSVYGYKLPDGLQLGARLPEPLFTPTTKADIGDDLPISFEGIAAQYGYSLAYSMRQRSLALFAEASDWCLKRGILLCDTKLEFGVLDNDSNDPELVLGDELFTPDSSRFFMVEDYHSGKVPHPWDKQFVADYLTQIGWNLIDDMPEIPETVVDETANRYEEIVRILTSATAGMQA